MVNPIYIFIIALGAGFLLTLFQKVNRYLGFAVFFGALLAMTVISGSWLWEMVNGVVEKVIYTAGFKPPYSINLLMGKFESFLTFSINLVGVMAALFLLNPLSKTKSYAPVLFLMLIMGLNGIVMTRDLFNLFVFLEIASIATISIIMFDHNYHSLAAGFKYTIASGIASAFFLIGTIYIYLQTGTLNIDNIIASKVLLTGSIGFIAVFLLISAMMIELKPFPANGWALDVYQSVNSGITSIIAVANSGAIIYGFYKLLPLIHVAWLPVIAGVGVVTFLVSNLMGLKQQNARRLLGYSSIGQMGLLLAAIVFLNMHNTYSARMYLILGGLFLNHFIAKAGLFWISGIVQKEKIEAWHGLRQKPLLLTLFGLFIIGLAGLPPFPGFWAKWELVMHLFSNQMAGWVWVILLGSLLEAVYLLRWFGMSFQKSENLISVNEKIQWLPVILFALLYLVISVLGVYLVPGINFWYLLPVGIGALLLVLDFLPAKIKGAILLALIGGYLWQIWPQVSPIYQFFAMIFLGGAAVEIISTMNAKGRRIGFYPLLGTMIFSLGILLQAETTLQFFLAWELMTVSSWLLVIRGKKSQTSALKYIIFSLGGAFLILIAFGYSFMASGNLSLNALAAQNAHSTLILVLLSIGFLVKTGSIGLHVWLPGAYSESEDDFSAIISSVLSKAGIFGLLMAIMLMGNKYIGHVSWNLILGWLGVSTAFAGAFMAAFQEDIKKLLAYSSMGQVGYMVLALAVNSHLGWVTAVYLGINHLFFKGMLFMTIAGVIYRTKTSLMYQMGGLIRTMPFSFISVLIGIIALSGVPPLSGFGGKWMLYNALIEKGWYFQAGMAFFASAVAFLYCFRLIHSIFLGQEKDKYRNIKEAPAWYLIPSFIFIGGIMAISMFPSIIMNPLIAAVGKVHPAMLKIDGNLVTSSMGYWNGSAIMMVTMGVFVVLLLILLARIRSVTKIKQFNIVFAAERPLMPEATHVAWNFFAPYQKALGFLGRPNAILFWNGVSEWTHSLGALFRNIYTGNGQTYAMQIFLFVVVFYFILGVM